MCLKSGVPVVFGHLVLQTSSIIVKHRGINSADLAFEHEMFVYFSVFVTSATGFHQPQVIRRKVTAVADRFATKPS